MTRDARTSSGASAALDAASLELIRTTPGQLLGGGYQASVHRYSTPAGEIVVKKPHAGALAPIWRHLLRHEQSAYERLAGIPGIPRSYGLIDGRYLALEYVAGPSLRAQEHQLVDRGRFFGLLLDTLHAMHSAGVAHRDLKRKDNVVVGAGEQPYLLDFGVASLRHATGTLVNRWTFEYACRTDYNSWIKLKYGRSPAGLSVADAELYRPSRLEAAARVVRVAWQKVTLRRPRQRWRRERDARRSGDKNS